MSIFSKANSKEYNERLENILETKKVNSDTKNLLLSMLYKIENSYEDYCTVKRTDISKEKFIEKILTIIETECKEIKAVTPGTEKIPELEKNNIFVDAKEGKIISYANEKDLLYSIFMLDIQLNQLRNEREYNFNIAKREEIIQYRAIQEFLSTGNAMSESEITRDFSGWSWSVNTKDIENITMNLIYQDILLLVGEKSLSDLVTPKIKKNSFAPMQANVKDLREYNKIASTSNSKKLVTEYNEIIKNAFLEKYPFESVDNLVYNLNLAILAFKLKDDKDNIKQIGKRIREEKKILALMENKKEFIKLIQSNKIKLERKIEETEIILSNPKLLLYEYNKRNKKLGINEKIFSTTQLAKILEKEIRTYKNEIKSEIEIVDPKKYVEKQEQYDSEVRFYDGIIKSTEDMHKILVDIQLDVIKCFNILIEKARTKDSLLNLIYKLRYYCMLPFDENTKIIEVEELKEAITDTINHLLDKSIYKRVLENVSNSISLCFNILKYIFKTQAITLENLSVKITKDREEIVQNDKEKDQSKLYYITIDFYDENEKVETHSEVVDNLGMLNIRQKKRVALFL